MKRLMRRLVLAAYDVGYRDASSRVETQHMTRAAYREGYSDASSKKSATEFGPVESSPKAMDAREILKRIDPTDLAGLQ